MKQSLRMVWSVTVGAAALIGCSAAPLSAQKVQKASKPPVAPLEPQARRLTVSATGYGRAVPDSAVVLVPVRLEAESYEGLMQRQREYLGTVQSAALLEPTTPGAVWLSDSSTSQSTRDGRTLITLEGRVGVRIQDIDSLPRAIAGLKRTAGQISSVRFQVSRDPALDLARRQAQSAAVIAARRDANLLSSAAGTHVVGVWEMNQGEIQSIPPVDAAFDGTVPRNIPVMSARVTVVFEMAGPGAAKAGRPHSPVKSPARSASASHTHSVSIQRVAR